MITINLSQVSEEACYRFCLMGPQGPSIMFPNHKARPAGGL